MNITLTPDLEKLVQEKVGRGDYENADALVQEAVHRLLEEDEADLDALRRKIRDADAEIDRGEGLEYDEHTTKDLAHDIQRRGVKRLAEMRKSGAGG